MAKLNEIYKCNVCGNIVEVAHAGAGTLVCCGQPMKLMTPNTVDAAQEKHVPVIEQDGNKFTVKVSSVPHPMAPEHYIEWVELLVGNRVYKKFLKPGEEPQATFCVETNGEPVSAREYCNLHGLWEKDQKGEFHMKKYVCTLCGYVYDPAEGDSEYGIDPGTAFEDLPEDWVCPICGATKDDFEPQE